MSLCDDNLLSIFILIGFFWYFFANSIILFGKVAENIEILVDFEIFERIKVRSSLKPRSRISSASSNITVLILDSINLFFLKWSLILPGVQISSENFVKSFFFSFLYPFHQL